MAVKRRALAQRRKVVGYSQEKLAEVLRVERTTVMRWEAGLNAPQPWCRPRLAKALRVSVDELASMLALDDAADDTVEDIADEAEYDALLAAPWSRRGTVRAAVMLSGGDQVKRRRSCRCPARP